MFYNLIKFILIAVFYVSVIAIVVFIINKFSGNRSRTLNSSIFKMLLVSVGTYFLINTALPNYALNPTYSVEREGLLSNVNGEYLFNNALNDMTFRIGEGRSAEWVSASYGNIIQLEPTSDSDYTYKKYDRWIEHFVIQVPQADWDEISNEFGGEITYSILER